MNKALVNTFFVIKLKLYKTIHNFIYITLKFETKGRFKTKIHKNIIPTHKKIKTNDRDNTGNNNTKIELKIN